MPCYRCGARQVDPDRGETPWRRGVRGDRQVLICPGCQGSFDWMSDLDHCPVCSSVHLVRRLGEAECRDCGSVRSPASTPLPGHLAALAGGPDAPGGSEGSAGSAGLGEVGTSRPGEVADGLAQEVELALARVLGHTARSPASS
jgi:hypothetical protein